MAMRWVHCRTCGDEIVPPERGMSTSLCVLCGEEQARQERSTWCVAPMHKSNYMLFTNKVDLKGINNKGGLVK